MCCEWVKIPKKQWLKERRWVNDAPRVRFSTGGANRAILNYKAARDYGYTQELSVRFALQRCEDVWHSGNRATLGMLENGRKPRWMYSNRIDYSKERFVRLLSNTVHAKVSLTSIDRTDVVEIPKLLVHYLDSGKQPRFYKESLKSYVNYHTILGEYGPNKEIVVWHHCSTPKTRKEWLKYKRGRDLFLLWAFDINAALESMCSEYQIDPVWAAVTPDNIISAGYICSSYYLTRLPEIAPYVMRWKDWFQQDDNMARLDEIPRQGIPDPSIHPERLLIPHPTHYTSQSHREPSASHSYKIANKYGTFEKKGVLLKPIATYGELRDVGDKLHNCAASYHNVIDEGHCLLVVALRKDKPFALGELLHSNTKRYREWIQILGPSNKRITADVRKLFDSYLEEV